MTSQLALPAATMRKNYYVNLYLGDTTYKNRRLFIAFYGEDYASEGEAKRAATMEFLRTNDGLDFYDTVTLTEHNGMQIADKDEPYRSKSAIVRILATKNVPMIEMNLEDNF